ncbi:MAG: phosphoribosylaminoimidazolesuccinocarboxamide synthase [Elusimicrobia bacterium]|nr:phosphoribosylaminoimidazolesuccinocarboxamide synthase [Elusimicrobiota bacterium]
MKQAAGTLSALKLFRRGKVRDVYELGDELLLVASDRVSAFDCILPTVVPGKGEILTRMAAWWFKETAGLIPNHLISADWRDICGRHAGLARLPAAEFEGRSMLVRRAKRADVECVVRGYLSGSGWKEYRRTGTVCGLRLPPGLKESEKLPAPLFTPSTKADAGHDENITRGTLGTLVGKETAEELERLSLALYDFASRRMAACGLILADTKFEFGELGGRLIAIDEVVTPDSSRFWDAKAWKPGPSPANFDKQFIRDYLEKSGWDKQPPAPPLPHDVVERTARLYREALRKVTQ